MNSHPLPPQKKKKKIKTNEIISQIDICAPVISSPQPVPYDPRKAIFRKKKDQDVDPVTAM